MITNPRDEKNMGLTKEFEKFAKLIKKEGQEVKPFLYSGINESEYFKVPHKLPTVMLFKCDDKGSPITVELNRNELLKSVSGSH